MTETRSQPEERVERRIVLDVPPGQHERVRLDVYITGFVENATRTKVQQAIRAGQVRVNGQVLKPSYVVQPGDRIDCVILKPPPVELVPQDLPIEVVHEDDDLLVVNKAAGMVVHPGYGHRDGTLVNAVLHHLGAGSVSMEELEDDEADDETVGLSTVGAGPRYAGDPAIRPGLVHRLDKDTSGLMVIAKNDAAHVGLARQFEARTIRRLYRALVWGTPDPAEGRVETHIGRDPRDRKRMAVVEAPSGKHAATRYRTVEALRHTSLLEFRLETGRTHQIRVHARQLGHPVFGDPTYDGRTIRVHPLTARIRAFYLGLLGLLPRQALHAYTLGFVHPSTGREVDFEAALPGDMQEVLDRLRADRDRLISVRH